MAGEGRSGMGAERSVGSLAGGGGFGDWGGGVGMEFLFP